MRKTETGRNLNFTKKGIDALPTPVGKRAIYHDTRTRGFGLLIQPTGHRAFFWFRVLRILAVIYVPTMLFWVVAHQQTVIQQGWKPSFRADFSSLLTGPAETFAISGALLAALCITMGSWYLVREARTPLHHSPSR